MKKLSSRHLVVLMLVTIMSLSCEEHKKPNGNDNQPNDDDYSNVKPPKKIVSVEKSIDLFDAYAKNRAQLIEPRLRALYKDSSFVDTKFVWYSLKELKEYIAYIEKVQKVNPAYDVTGLRLYYGAYSDKNQSNKFPNQQTFFMVPTMKAEKQDRSYNNMNHIPFYIEYEAGKNPIKGKFVAIDELMLDYNKKERLKPYTKSNISGSMASMVVEKSETSLAHNEGEASPPPRR